MKIVVNNYHNNDLSWLKSDDLVVYDKKDKNVGSNIYDYMDYIVENYDNLPDVVMFTKGNMLERHITPEEFEKVRNNTTLTPLMTMNHKTYLPVCFYKDGLYWEENSYWYVNEHPQRYMQELIDLLGVRGEKYLGFSPGACWIVNKTDILKRSKEFYSHLMSFIDYDSNPAEAHLLERALGIIWQYYGN